MQQTKTHFYPSNYSRAQISFLCAGTIYFHHFTRQLSSRKRWFLFALTVNDRPCVRYIQMVTPTSHIAKQRSQSHLVYIQSFQWMCDLAVNTNRQCAKRCRQYILQSVTLCPPEARYHLHSSPYLELII